MRGRTPAGVHYVDQLPGSGEAKERLKALLDVMSGACRLFEACDRLDLCPQRLHQLREDWLTRSVQGLEPQKAGRKPHVPSPEHERIRQLEQQVADLELELRATRAREEIALILPPAQTPAAEKKTRRRGRPPQPPTRTPPAPRPPAPDCPPGMRKST
jgi:hypothetical protein